MAQMMKRDEKNFIHFRANDFPKPLAVDFSTMRSLMKQECFENFVLVTIRLLFHLKSVTMVTL